VLNHCHGICKLPTTLQSTDCYLEVSVPKCYSDTRDPFQAFLQKFKRKYRTGSTDHFEEDAPLKINEQDQFYSQTVSTLPSQPFYFQSRCYPKVLPALFSGPFLSSRPLLSPSYCYRQANFYLLGLVHLQAVPTLKADRVPFTLSVKPEVTLPRTDYPMQKRIFFA